MTTSKKVASDAARTLDNPKSSKLEKELAASDLAQAKRKRPSKKGTLLYLKGKPRRAKKRITKKKRKVKKKSRA